MILTAEEQEVKALLESVQFTRLAATDHLHDDIIRLVIARTADLTQRLVASEAQCANHTSTLECYRQVHETAERQLAELREPMACGCVKANTDEKGVCRAHRAMETGSQQSEL